MLTALLVGAQAGAAATPEEQARYRHWCARCHGEQGDGRGLAAVALAFNGSAPRDFRSGAFKVKTTPSGQPATDDDLRRTIRNGLPGTSMPYFRDLLSAAEIGGLVSVIRGFARVPAAPADVIDLGPPPPQNGPSRAHGAELYRALGCPECHGAEGRGDGPSAPALRNADGSRAVAADLTRPWAFRGGAEAADVAMRLATGVAGTPMPSYRDSASIDDLWQVTYHVRSLARAPSLRAAAILDARLPPGAGESPVARGEYVAKAGTCFLCHAQMNPDGSYAEGRFAAGGMKVEIAYVGTQYSRNLTPDERTGIGSWSAGDFERVFRSGRSTNGRVLNPLDMPWTAFTQLESSDIEALFAYFRSLPAVANAIPPPAGPGLVAGVGRKAVALLTGSHDDAWFAFHPGNAGGASASAEAPHNPRDLAWLALGCGIAVVVLARRPRRSRWSALGIAAAIVVPLVYAWPPVTLMPASFTLAQPPLATPARLFRMPPIHPPPAPPALEDPDLQRLAARGRYVATIGSCSLCHTAGPSWIRPRQPFPELGGGMKVSWSVFGTTYSRNLTPDDETGLGRWTPEEIRRAVTSGIARDGRLMHWQAMPWDHFSHLRPEDLEALVFYLRTLAPVHSRIPGQEPPSPGDRPALSFWLGYSGEYRP